MGAPDQANATIYTFCAYKSRTKRTFAVRSDGAAAAHVGVEAALFVEELGEALKPHHLAIVYQPNCRRWPLRKSPDRVISDGQRTHILIGRLHQNVG